MSKFNIYQIRPQLVSDLQSKFEQVGLLKQKEITISDFKMTFYFSDSPDENTIWWISTYRDFFTTPPSEQIKNRNYYAALLAERNGLCYAISLGKSHFYIQKYSLLDFGIEVATRILDENGVVIKNARKFGSSRKKTLVTYKESSFLEIESGETVEYLRGSTGDKDTWGRKATFGTSAQFSIKGVSPHDLPKLLEKIEEKLLDSPNFKIPRTFEIKDQEEICNLDAKLVTAISGNSTAISLEELSLSGIDFIFLSDYRYSLRGQSREVPISTSMSQPELLEAITLSGNSLNNFSVNEIKIKAESEYGRGYTKSLKEFLDYTDNEWNYLRDGRWFKFNQEYKESLIAQVDSIEIEQDETIAYSEVEFARWKETLPESDRSKWYAEKYFNEIIASSHGFRSYDRNLQTEMGYRVEYCDLLLDECLYFVKIGTPQKLGYVIDQSINSLRLLVKNKHIITIGDEELKPKSYALWLIMNRSQRISKLSQINSIIFLQKVSDWIREVHNANLQPRIVISYKVD